jgi:PPP family 3-phenylpropionic acid transporter
VRLWGSIAFVIGSALTGKLVSLFDYRAILLMLSLGVASMLLGMLLKPSVMPQGSRASSRSRTGGLADAGTPKLALSRLRLSAAGGARRLLRL